MHRQLRGVEALPPRDAQGLLGLGDGDEERGTE
jgi:hypothetical protein